MSNNIFDLEKEKEINKHLEHKCDTCNNMCKRKNCR